MLKVGDKVKFLNQVGGGVVKSFINKNMVNVENEDGFEIPYPISQLVNVNAPELNVTEETKRVETAQEKVVSPVFEEPQGEIINGKNSPDFYFCFVPSNPKNPVENEIELFLLNDSNFTLLFNFSYFQEGKNISIKKGTVPPNSRQKLESLTQSDLVELPEYRFQIIYFREEENDWHEPVSKKFKINPVKFYKESTFRENIFFQKNAMVLKIEPNPLQEEVEKLKQEDLIQQLKGKEMPEVKQKPVRKKNPEELVIDLHINELLDDTKGLSNREILEIQQEKVESETKLAIRNHVKRIVFIHGVGQGVLKQEIAKLLKTKFPKFYFQDASFKEYGYGATMVILRRGK